MKYDKNKHKELEFNSIGDVDEGMDASIDLNNMGFIFSLVTNDLYKDPQGSIVREIASNCIDAHVETKSSEPIIISLKIDRESAKDNENYDDSVGISSVYNEYNLDWELCFIDKGPGMSPEFVKDTYSKYFSSTKRESNEGIGMFGIGSKSPLAYADYFKLSTTVDGISYEYIVHRGENVPRIEPFGSEATDEPNGTKVTIPIEGKDVAGFARAINKQIAYFNNIYVDMDEHYHTYDCMFDNDYKVDEFLKGYILRQPNAPIDKPHIVLGNVFYAIDWEELGIDPPKLSVGIKFNIGDLGIVPSRESIKYTEEAKDLLRGKLEELSEVLYVDIKEKNWELPLFSYMCILSDIRNHRVLEFSLGKTSKMSNFIFDFKSIIIYVLQVKFDSVLTWNSYLKYFPNKTVTELGIFPNDSLVDKPSRFLQRPSVPGSNRGKLRSTPFPSTIHSDPLQHARDNKYKPYSCIIAPGRLLRRTRGSFSPKELFIIDKGYEASARNRMFLSISLNYTLRYFKELLFDTAQNSAKLGSPVVNTYLKYCKEMLRTAEESMSNLYLEYITKIESNELLDESYESLQEAKRIEKANKVDIPNAAFVQGENIKIHNLTENGIDSFLSLKGSFIIYGGNEYAERLRVLSMFHCSYHNRKPYKKEYSVSGPKLFLKISKKNYRIMENKKGAVSMEQFLSSDSKMIRQVLTMAKILEDKEMTNIINSIDRTKVSEYLKMKAGHSVCLESVGIPDIWTISDKFSESVLSLNDFIHSPTRNYTDNLPRYSSRLWLEMREFGIAFNLFDREIMAKFEYVNKYLKKAPVLKALLLSGNVPRYCTVHVADYCLSVKAPNVNSEWKISIVYKIKMFLEVERNRDFSRMISENYTCSYNWDINDEISRTKDLSLGGTNGIAVHTIKYLKPRLESEVTVIRTVENIEIEITVNNKNENGESSATAKREEFSWSALQ